MRFLKRWRWYIYATVAAVFVWYMTKIVKGLGVSAWEYSNDWDPQQITSFAKGLYEVMDGWSLDVTEKESYWRGITEMNDWNAMLVGVAWNSLYPGENLVTWIGNEFGVLFVTAKHAAIDKLLAVGYTMYE